MDNKDNKPISLTELSNGVAHRATINGPTPLPRLNIHNVKEANINEIALPKQKDRTSSVDNVPYVVRTAIYKIPEAVQRLRNESLEYIKKGEEMRAEQDFLNNDDITVRKGINGTTPNNTGLYRNIEYDEDLYDDDDDDVEFPEL